MENLKNKLETAYKEYKEYKEFAESIKEQVDKNRKDFAEFALQNVSNPQLLTDKFLEVNEKPTLYQNDLMKLQLRLVSVFDTIKEDVENIPQELVEEVETYRVDNIFKIVDNAPIAINQEIVDRIAQMSREKCLESFKQVAQKHKE